MPRNGPRGTAVLLVVAALVASGLMILRVVTSAPQEPTILEFVLFQVIVFLLGLTGSYLFGRYSAQSAAQELLHQKARSSFRRIMSLYRAFQRLAISIEERRKVIREVAANHAGSVPLEHTEAGLDVINADVIAQIGTADDAAEDWRDLVPEEIERMEQELDERQRRRRLVGD